MINLKKIPVLPINLKNKRIIVRIDINSPVKNNKPFDNPRFSAAAETIKFLKKHEAKIILLAHQSNPGKSDFISLKNHARILSKYTKVTFINSSFHSLEKTIKSLKPSEAILLDNIRFQKDEMLPDAPYTKLLSQLADIYINDAFSVSHRQQASITGFPNYLPSYLSPNHKKEIHALLKLQLKNSLYILSGAKPKENLLFFKKNQRIIASGIFGQLCLASKGFKFGKHESLLPLDYLKQTRQAIKKTNPILPEDFAVSISGKRRELPLTKFPNKYIIYDIGKISIEKFKKEIKKAKVIFMKGPLGYIEEQKFSQGTKEILQTIAKSKSFSILGGGHLTTALKKFNISSSKFNHISLSGGALATLVSGNTLPGLEAIQNCTFNKHI